MGLWSRDERGLTNTADADVEMMLKREEWTRLILLTKWRMIGKELSVVVRARLLSTWEAEADAAGDLVSLRRKTSGFHLEFEWLFRLLSFPLKVAIC